MVDDGERLTRSSAGGCEHGGNDRRCTHKAFCNMNAELSIIRSYVEKQAALVDCVKERLDGSIGKFDLRNAVPASVKTNGIAWTLSPHGLGVCFKSEATEEVIDVHVGFLDAPNAFDAWRLALYCESLHLRQRDHSEWDRTLLNLAACQSIIPHAVHSKHYVLPN